MYRTVNRVKAVQNLSKNGCNLPLLTFNGSEILHEPCKLNERMLRYKSRLTSLVKLARAAANSNCKTSPGFAISECPLGSNNGSKTLCHQESDIYTVIGILYRPPGHHVVSSY